MTSGRLIALREKQEVGHDFAVSGLVLEAVEVTSEAAVGEIAREFPGVVAGLRGRGVTERRHVVTLPEWDDPSFNTWELDVAIDELACEPFTLALVGERSGFPVEVLTRCQRWIRRRNAASSSPLFDRVLARHAELHDISKPLVRADYNHAVDVWQWLLRLDAEAPLALQLAALFHDVERLVSEADLRVEHLAADYQQFKNAHARAGAAMALRVLDECGVDAATRARVAELIAAHEQPSASDNDVALLNDVDALSFFSLNSSGYADYFGPEQTRKKVAYTLGRMRPWARAKLGTVRLRPDVAVMLVSCHG